MRKSGLGLVSDDIDDTDFMSPFRTIKRMRDSEKRRAEERRDALIRAARSVERRQLGFRGILLAPTVIFARLSLERIRRTDHLILDICSDLTDLKTISPRVNPIHWWDNQVDSVEIGNIVCDLLQQFDGNFLSHSEKYHPKNFYNSVK